MKENDEAGYAGNWDGFWTLIGGDDETIPAGEYTLTFPKGLVGLTDDKLEYIEPLEENPQIVLNYTITGKHEIPDYWNLEGYSLVFSPQSGEVVESVPEVIDGQNAPIYMQLWAGEVGHWQTASENPQLAAVNQTPVTATYEGTENVTEAELPVIDKYEWQSSGTSINATPKKLVLSFAENSPVAKKPGKYTFTFEPGFFKADGAPNGEPIVVEYTIAGNPFEQWTVNPAKDSELPDMKLSDVNVQITFPQLASKDVKLSEDAVIEVNSQPFAHENVEVANGVATLKSAGMPDAVDGKYNFVINEGAFYIDGEDDKSVAMEFSYTEAKSRFADYTVEPEDGSDFANPKYVSNQNIVITFPDLEGIDVTVEAGAIKCNGNTVEGITHALKGYLTIPVSALGEVNAEGKYVVTIAEGGLSTSAIPPYTLKNGNEITLTYGVTPDYFSGITFNPERNEATGFDPEAYENGITITFPEAVKADMEVELNETDSNFVSLNGEKVEVVAGKGTVTFPAALFTDLPKNEEFTIEIPADVLSIGGQTYTETLSGNYIIAGPLSVQLNARVWTRSGDTDTAPYADQMHDLANISAIVIWPTGAFNNSEYSTPAGMFPASYNEELLKDVKLTVDGTDVELPNFVLATTPTNTMWGDCGAKFVFETPLTLPGEYTLTIPDGFVMLNGREVLGTTLENFSSITAKPDYFGDNTFVYPTEEVVTSISRMVIDYPNLTPEQAKDVVIDKEKMQLSTPVSGLSFDVEFDNEGQLVVTFAEQTTPGEYQFYMYEKALSYDGVESKDWNNGFSGKHFTIKYNYFSDVLFLEPENGKTYIDETVQDFVLRVESKNGQTVNWVGEASDITVKDEDENEYEVNAESIKIDSMTQNLQFSTVEPLTYSHTYTATVAAGSIEIMGDKNPEAVSMEFTIKPDYFKGEAITKPEGTDAFESVDSFEVSFPGFEGNLTEEIQPEIAKNAATMITITKGEETWSPIASSLKIEGNALVFETDRFIYNGVYTLTIPAGIVTVDGQANKEMTTEFTISQLAFPETTILPEGVEDCVRSLDGVTVNFASAVKTVSGENTVSVMVGEEEVEATLDQAGLNLTIPVEQTTLGEVSIEIPANVLTVGAGASLNEGIAISYTVVPEFMARPTLEPANEETIVNLDNMIVRYSSTNLPEGLAPLEEEKLRTIEVTDGTNVWYGSLTEFVEGSTTRVDIKFADANGDPADIYQEGTYNVTIPAGVFVDARTAGMALQTTNNTITATYTVKELPYYFQGSVWTPAKGEEVTTLGEVTITFPNRVGVDADGNDFDYPVELNEECTEKVTVNGEAVEASVKDNVLVISVNENVEGEYELIVPADYVTIHSVGNNKGTATYTIVKPAYFAGATVAPAAGAVESLKEFTVTFPAKGDFKPVLAEDANITVTRAKGTPVVAKGSVNADGQLVIALDEEITLGGSYTLNIPKGAVSIDDLPSPAAITAVYSIAKEDYFAGAAITAPEAGIVETLKDFTVEFPGKLDFKPELKAAATAITVKNAAGQTAATVASASIDAEGNLVFSLRDAVTAAGTYTVTVPASAISIDDVLNAAAITAEYEIEVKTDAAWWQRAIVTPAGSTLRTEPAPVEELETMTVSFPGATTILAEGEVITLENLDAADEAQSVAPVLTGGEYALRFQFTDNQGDYALTIPAATFFSEDAGKNPEMTWYYHIDAISNAEFWTAEFTPADGDEDLKSIQRIDVTFPKKRGDIQLGTDTQITLSGEDGTTVNGTANISGSSIWFQLEKAVTEPGKYTVNIPAGVLVAQRTKYGESPAFNLSYEISPLPIDEAAFAGAYLEETSGATLGYVRVILPNKGQYGIYANGEASEIVAKGPEGASVAAIFAGGYSQGLSLSFPETTTFGEYEITIPEGYLALCELNEYYSADPNKKVALNPEFSVTFTVEEPAPLEVDYTFGVVDANGTTVASAEATELEGVKSVIIYTDATSFGWGAWRDLLPEAYVTDGTETYSFSSIKGVGNTAYQLDLTETLTAPGTYSLYVPEGIITIDNRLAPEVNGANIFTIKAEDEPTVDPTFWEDVTFDPADGETVKSISTVAAYFAGDVTKGENPVITLKNETTEGELTPTNILVMMDQVMIQFAETAVAGDYTLTIGAGSFTSEKGGDSPEFKLSFVIEEAEPSNYWEDAQWTPAEGSTVASIENGTVSVVFPNSDEWVGEGDVIYRAILVNETTGTNYAYSWSDVNDNWDGGDITFNMGQDISEPGEYVLTVPAGSWTSTKGVAEDSPEFTVSFTIEGQPAPSLDGMLDKYEADPADGESISKFSTPIKVTFPDLGDEYGFFLADYIVSLTDENGESYTASIDIADLEGAAMAGTSVVIEVKAEEYPAGLYTLVIPAGTIQLCSRDDWDGVYDVFNPEIKLTYHVTEGVGIFSVLDEAETYTVVDYAGRVIVREGTAQDVLDLNPGFYIINGKRVNIRK